jgi:hypothetical protein
MIVAFGYMGVADSGTPLNEIWEIVAYKFSTPVWIWAIAVP